MNTLFQKTLTIASLILLIFTLGCKKDPPKVIPSVSTTSVTDITSATATAGGTVTLDGGAPITARGVCWNTTQNPTISDFKTNDGTGIGTFVSSITGLTPGATYYVRAYATNSVGTAYGAQITLKTTAFIPTVTTSAISAITSINATSGGNITNDGGAPVTVRGVCWSTSENPNTLCSKTTDGLGTGSFTSSITGLTRNTSYYIRAYATNSVGTGYGYQLRLDTPGDLATITTSAVTEIKATTAVSGGYISNDGGAIVTFRGVCWNTNLNPTIENSHIDNGWQTGSFSCFITGLIPETTYYIRAYATNSAGTAYGSNISFKTLKNSGNTVTDVEGNVYETVTIGTQVWMAENLKTTRYTDHSVIGTTIPATYNISKESYPAYQWPCAGNENNVPIYGRQYTYWAVINNKGICPVGWHVPTHNEWTTLEEYLGGSGVAGGKLKETSTTHWVTPNTGATNSSGFTALPGGYRSFSGTFYYLGSDSFFWSRSGSGIPNSYGRLLNSASNIVYQFDIDKSNGCSVRCVKD